MQDAIAQKATRKTKVGAVRLTHLPSGAVVQCGEYSTVRRNALATLARLPNSPTFSRWASSVSRTTISDMAAWKIPVMHLKLEVRTPTKTWKSLAHLLDINTQLPSNAIVALCHKRKYHAKPLSHTDWVLIC